MSSLVEYLASALSGEKGTDVTIVAGTESEKKEIGAHSLILRRAGYFSTALDSAFQESASKKFVFEDVEPIHMELLIKSLYTDSLAEAEQQEPLQLLQLLSLCRRFDFPEVVTKHIFEKLVEQVQWGSNVAVVIAKAQELDFPQVTDWLLEKISCDLSSLKNEFQLLHEKGDSMGSEALFSASISVIDKVVNVITDTPITKPIVKSFSATYQYSPNHFMSTNACKEHDVSVAIDKLHGAHTAREHLWAFLFFRLRGTGRMPNAIALEAAKRRRLQ